MENKRESGRMVLMQRVVGRWNGKGERKVGKV